MNSFERYSRQIQLPEIGNKGQQKLAKAKVLIIGVGGLGCSVAQHLVASGVGIIGLLDHDLVDISNLNRQILFTESDVGRGKVNVAKEALLKMNDQVQIHAYHEQLSFENALDLFPDYDIIIDGTDNFQTKYLINDACVLTNKPWIYASIYKYQGQLSVFNYNNGPTYRCLYPKVNSSNISCEETGVLGVLPAILGTMQASEAIKIILKIGRVLSGKLFIIDMLTWEEQQITFSRSESQVRVVKNRTKIEHKNNGSFKACGKIYLDIREMIDTTIYPDKKVLHIPLAQLEKRHIEIPRDIPVHVYCQTGTRSREAIEQLSEKYGFQNLINVNGGIQSLDK
jgi:adenylyltransferase/sulfurtransferase